MQSQSRWHQPYSTTAVACDPADQQTGLGPRRSHFGDQLDVRISSEFWPHRQAPLDVERSVCLAGRPNVAEACRFGARIATAPGQCRQEARRGAAR